MIQISGIPFQQSSTWINDSIESSIIQSMQAAPSIYSYQSINELLFELKLRKNIIESALAMNQGQAQFESFDKTRANPQYWEVTDDGGLQLKPGVKPSVAISDIFQNSAQYAFECATAILIIYYRAVLLTIGAQLFNQYFQDLYLYSWHSDSDLGIQVIDTSHFIPGDVVYFNNPEFHPETPWWRGENAVYLGNDSYFGHGIGIGSADQLIQALNDVRKPGSNQSAYLINSAIRPSFTHLMHLSTHPRSYQTYKVQLVVIHHNESSISLHRYVLYLNQFYNQRT
ncbi:protein-glutamine gamma-glutamyltransferase [Bacillus massiliigorillae]|uniref:protein-glutamine gamma-glutamyltransferase n=1 Tax=Bacillus massiliigorillae TaxID=1243664 RepID=UPI0005A74127|nr:protein-glutamine gamma-glutamyltransferase [Bacillus massiliigorillae]